VDNLESAGGRDAGIADETGTRRDEQDHPPSF
jgi:hypothetical protein